MIDNCRTLYAHLYHGLLPVAETPAECRSITLRLLEYYFHCDSLSVSLAKPLHPALPASSLDPVLARLQAHEPIQYILGQAPFMGRIFVVMPGIFIPRLETEELVDCLLREENTKGLSVLDIGTGSGCIAITLAKELPAAQVDALDISAEALSLVTSNARLWQAPVNGLQRDILTDPLPNKKWDIFVSNPPYVTESEKKYMSQRVLAYEPGHAIFVPDDRPLLFYERIIALAQVHLNPGGKIYFEINERYGHSIAYTLTQHSFCAIEIRQDLQGKDRWIKATWLGKIE